MSIHKIIAWALVVFCMALIFSFSSQAATHSNELSTGITQVLVKIIHKAAPRAELNVQTFNNIVRKNAHFIIYMLLGILVTNALRRNGIKGRRSFWLALAICALFAVSDEIHQLFVPGRGCQLTDILIDSTGAGVGICIYWLASFIKRGRERPG